MKLHWRNMDVSLVIPGSVMKLWIVLSSAFMQLRFDNTIDTLVWYMCYDLKTRPPRVFDIFRVCNGHMGSYGLIIAEVMRRNTRSIKDITVAIRTNDYSTCATTIITRMRLTCTIRLSLSANLPTFLPCSKAKDRISEFAIIFPNQNNFILLIAVKK